MKSELNQEPEHETQKNGSTEHAKPENNAQDTKPDIYASVEMANDHAAQSLVLETAHRTAHRSAAVESEKKTVENTHHTDREQVADNVETKPDSTPIEFDLSETLDIDLYGMTLSQAYRETGVSQDVTKKLVADLPIIGRYNGGYEYDRAILLKRINEYKSIPKKPPKGYAHLASIANAIGVHKSRLYEAEKLGSIKPDGQYLVCRNGRMINYYKITKIAKKYKKTIDAKKLDHQQPGIACYGQLPTHIRNNLALLNKAFSLANGTFSHG